MFTLDNSGAFNQTVKFTVTGDAGRVDAEFVGTFKRLDASAIDALVSQSNSDAELVRAVLVNWSGVVDQAKAPVPFSPEALGRLLEVPGMASLVSLAFLEGARTLPRKN